MLRRRLVFVAFLSVVMACVAGQAVAELKAHPLFTDHMVLQRNLKIPVWGTANPGEQVVVSVNGRDAKTKAEANGEWMVELRSMRAGGPYDMVIKGEQESITVSDVLVGEVWVASGQSNMEWPLTQINNTEQEIASANYPRIRLFHVPHKTADAPQKTVEAAWSVCSPEAIPDFSAVAYLFGRYLHKELEVPIGLIQTTWGGTPVESWTSREVLETVPESKAILTRWDKTVAEYPAALEAYNKALAEWEKAAAQAKADGKEEPKKPGAPAGPDHPWRPASLYNGMIAPLIPYAIRGAIWYQGESNADRAYQYRKLFPAMIENWRDDWNQKKMPFYRGKFPFYFVQLANFMERQPEPGPHPWAELREAQTMTLDLKNTGMAVIIDIGEAGDIHPRNKQDVGKRLALAALANDYDKVVAYSGPMYKSKRVKDGKVVLTFKHTNGGLVAKDGDLKGFAIAGADKNFVWAKAEIIGKKKIAVWSDQVADPVAVRYAWAANPECNLYNSADLPASPFRTDDWPGETINNE